MYEVRRRNCRRHRGTVGGRLCAVDRHQARNARGGGVPLSVMFSFHVALSGGHDGGTGGDGGCREGGAAVAPAVA